MLDENLKKTFDQDGCVILKNLLSEDKVKLLKERVVELAEKEKNTGDAYLYPFDESGKTQRVWNLTNKGEIFRDLLEIEVVDDFMNYIFDRKTQHQKYFLSSYQANILNPGCIRQKLHIDTPAPEPLPEWAIKANAIWFLDDFTELNGATEYIPGTHKLKYKPSPKDNEECEVIKACGPAGSVLISHGALWHRAGANISGKPRVALLCSMAASYALEIAHEEDQSLIISQKVIEGLSEKVKQIIGVGHGIKAGSMVEHLE
jgi:ectoine hydroxylase-related dioxygenase (phytanoyl-CoA dioxygenase family)